MKLYVLVSFVSSRANAFASEGEKLFSPYPPLSLVRASFSPDWSPSLSPLLFKLSLYCFILKLLLLKSFSLARRISVAGEFSPLPHTSRERILDGKRTAKENWEILRQQNLGMDRVIQSRIQGMKRDFELLMMGKTDSVMDFVTKFTHIVSDLRNLGEMMDEKEVVKQFLWVTPFKFDALTLSLEQYGDLDKVSLDEVIGSLTIHELQLRERESREEEQALLIKALSKAKLSTEDESSSRGKRSSSRSWQR